jgi:citrate lyase gamma subunit
MSGVANSTSTAAATNGAQNITVTITSSVAAQFNNAISSTRTTFLITQAQYSSISANFKVTDVLSATTFVTTSQTVSSVTQNYATIAGTAYALITMSSTGNSTSTAGATNVSITATSSFTAQYGSALSSSRSDFLVTDAAWTASGIAAGDSIAVASFLTGGQQINSVTPAYINLGGTSYTRVLMSGNANGTSTSGSGNDVTITATAAGSGASYQNKNFLFFDSTSWLASTATISTKIAVDQTAFPAGTSVSAVTTRTFGATTVYRVTFTQSANTTVNAASTLKFQFGAAYALPGEQVFSFIATSGASERLDLQELKELTSTSIGGRGTFPNGPDVLAVNVYKTSGTSTVANLILRWGEAQA